MKSNQNEFGIIEKITNMNKQQQFFRFKIINSYRICLPLQKYVI